MSDQRHWRELIREWLLVSMAEQGLTQAALASESGISQPQISKYTLGKDLPGDNSLERLAVALGRPAPRMLFVTPPSPRAELAEEAGPSPHRLRDQLLAIFDALQEERQEELVGAALALRLLEEARTPR